MEMNLCLVLALLIALLVIGYLLAKLHRVRGQLSLIKDALTDIKNGNLNRRVLARESDLTNQICYPDAQRCKASVPDHNRNRAAGKNHSGR